MKVKELIDALQHEDPEAPVVFAYPAGDYWGNVLASSPDCVSRGRVTHSDYHGTGKLVEDGSDEENDEDTHEAVVLSEEGY